MTRALVVVGTALALLIGGLSLAVVLGREEGDLAVDNPLAEDLTRAIALSERVDLAARARFPWDEVLIVAPGTPPAAISDRLGYEWEADDFPTGELFLFVRDGRVVRFADYRGLGRFEGFREPIDALPRARAVLRVRNLVISPASARAAAGRLARRPRLA
jgi:hypothetical protein